MKDVNNLPRPIAKIVRQSEALFATEWFIDILPLIAKALEWTFIYLIGSMGFGYSNIPLLATLHYIKYRAKRNSLTDTMISHMSAAATDNGKCEQDLISTKMEQFPSWVQFPDFDRVEWINKILLKIWPKISREFMTKFVTDFIQPEIKHILDRMHLDTAAGFNVKKIDLGKIPARLGGIKVYSRNTDRNQIVLDCEVIYSGDARFLFTLQGVQAEVKDIIFKGMARVIIQPLLPNFPFVGGFEVYFINTPQLDYGLGGIATFAEIPGANTIIKSIIEDQIRSRFVWPNRFHLYLPIDEMENIADKSFKLAKPFGMLEISLIEARDLLKEDMVGLSDPYAVVKIGERQVSFVDSYAAHTLNPSWNYKSRFVMEDYAGQELTIEVFDYDKTSADDFLGHTSIVVDSLIDKRETDEWIKLDGVKTGDIHVAAKWKEVIDLKDDNSDVTEIDQYVISLYVDSCQNLTRHSKQPYPKCLVRHTQSGVVETTAVRNKTSNPVFEEKFLFYIESVDISAISVEVVDTRSGDESLGRAMVLLSLLNDFPRKEVFDMDFDLVDGPRQDAKITLSAKLYKIK